MYSSLYTYRVEGKRENGTEKEKGNGDALSGAAVRGEGVGRRMDGILTGTGRVSSRVKIYYTK